MEWGKFIKRKKLASIFLFFFILINLEAAPIKLKVILDNASIKATRAIGGKTLTQVPLDTILEAQRRQGEWYRVTWQGVSGFIHEMNVKEVSEAELAREETGIPARARKSQAEIVAEIELKMEEGRKFIRQEEDFEKAISSLKPLIAKTFNVTDATKQKELGAEVFLWLGLAAVGQGNAYSALGEFRNMFVVNHAYAKEITRNILDPEVAALIEQAEKEVLGLVTEYSIEISTEPKEARIKINGKEIGLSPEIYRTSSPKVLIEIEKEGYKPFSEEIFITQPATKKEYTLERAGRDVNVRSIPEGAIVYLDGEDTERETNCTLPIVPFGLHKIRVVKENYAEWEGEIKIEESEESFAVEAILTPNKYEYLSRWGGPTSGLFKLPSGITVDKENNIYVIDLGTIKIKKFDSEGKIQSTWGKGGKEFKIIKNPGGIAIDNQGYVYVTDTKNNCVMKFDKDGNYNKRWGTLGAGSNQFRSPLGIAVDSNNDVYVVDSTNNRIKKYSNLGVLKKTWGTQGTSDGEFVFPKAVALNQKNEVFVVDRTRVQKFTSDGEFISLWGKIGAGDGEFNSPAGIYIDQNNFVYVADSGNNRIQKFDENGKFIAKWGTAGTGIGQMVFPAGVAVDSRGYVYVIERDNKRVQLFGVVPPSK